MCGIAGIIQSTSGLYDRIHLIKMTDALTHRGPESCGSWQNDDQTTLLGHRRLSIIDRRECAAQPMHYLDRYTIIHNGEIYNYVELRSDLARQGYEFQTLSDTEVIVAAYDFYGEDCVQYFDGMFAFAIWDQQEKEFFAARDRFGEKPFFYSFNGRELLFASEMKALWAVGLEKKNNFQMLFNFITIGYADNPGRPEETFFENIFRLPAASCLFYSPHTSQLEIERYWDLDVSVKNTIIKDEEALEKFSALFQQSVRRRLRSDVAVGTSLSGGLDSSSVVAMIHDQKKSSGQSALKAFTAVFPGFEKNEYEWASRVARQFGLSHHSIEVTAGDLVNDWSRFIHHQEEPFGSASAYAQYKVFELAKQHDVTVLLDGQGADEILGGYTKYYKWYWQELFQKRKLVKSGEIKQARSLGVNESFNFKNIIAALFPDLASVLLERQYLVHALRQEDLTKEFVKLQSREAYYTSPVNFNLNGALYFNTCIHGLGELLRYADRNSMAFGREVRLPFLSHELVEFIFSLPSSFKIRDGWTKWLLRKALDKHLPEEITWRKVKVGFEPPQKTWMEHKDVREMIHEAKKKLVDLRVLKSSVLQKPVQATAAHEADNFDWRYLSAAACL